MLRQPVQRYASLVEPEDPYARFILEWTTMKSMTRINVAGGMNHLFRRVFGKEAPADVRSLLSATYHADSAMISFKACRKSRF